MNDLIESLNRLLSLNDENLKWAIANNDVQNALLQAADAIEQLARDNNVLTRERDAAIADLELARVCETCEYIQESCDDKCKYKWRGV